MCLYRRNNESDSVVSGYKESGIGREFSLEGMLESYTQRKNVTIKLTH
jgi:acyl-CoA reductase-like NAD-dependent aldehyde dehydrogenase